MLKDIKPMLYFSGLLYNVYLEDVFKDKDGKERPSRWVLQFLAKVPQKSGDIKEDLVNFTLSSDDDVDVFQKLAGKTIRFPIGFYFKGNDLRQWLLKGFSPSVVPDDSRMYLLSGNLRNIYMTMETVNRESGELVPAKLKMQMLCNRSLRDSDSFKFEQFNISVADDAFFKDIKSMEGKNILVPVGMMKQERSAFFWLLPNSKPEIESLPASLSAPVVSPIKSPLDKAV